VTSAREDLLQARHVRCLRAQQDRRNFAASSALLALPARGRACATSLSGYTALGWERRRQTEVRKHADLEAGDGADALTGKVRTRDRGAVPDGTGVVSVDRQSRLAVGSGLCEATVEVDDCDVDEEAGRPPRPRFEWQRRHGAKARSRRDRRLPASKPAPPKVRWRMR